MSSASYLCQRHCLRCQRCLKGPSAKRANNLKSIVHHALERSSRQFYRESAFFQPSSLKWIGTAVPKIFASVCQQNRPGTSFKISYKVLKGDGRRGNADGHPAPSRLGISDYRGFSSRCGKASLFTVAV